MGLFDLFKKPSVTPPASTGPYQEPSANLIYQLLFCDNLDLYRAQVQAPFQYPFDVLFSETSSVTDLQKLIDDREAESRIKILAYNRQLASGRQPAKKELLAIIVEVGLDQGLDVLASFSDGTARYINQTGKLIIWELANETSRQLTADLFMKSQQIVEKIGVWDQVRRPWPTRGNLRISFLVSDGLYFGEGPMNVLFNDSLAGPALNSAAELMRYLTEIAMEKK
jgi:hypothetical protein